MKAIDFSQQKELEAAITDLRVFMDIVAVSLHEANTAGKSGYILTIILAEDSDQVASDMYDWADKIFKRHVAITYRIINIRDLIDYIKSGNLYYIKWYFGGVHLFKNEEFDTKMKNEIPKAKDLLEKAIKVFTGLIQKIEALQRGAQHYEGTNNHQLALHTIHQTIVFLFGVVGKLVMGRAYSNKDLWNQQETVKDFAPLFAKLFDSNNAQDVQIVELLHKIYRDFPYYGKTKTKKELVTVAHKKMQRMLKEVKKVYKEQLSYCEEKLSTFIDPIQNPVKEVVLNDGTIIANIITSYIKTGAIYCFGKRETPTAHFHLLVLEEEHKENAVHDLADIIKSKTKGKCTVTLLIHNISELKTASGEQRYFFWNVVSNGKCLYQNEQIHLPYFEGTPKRNYNSAKEYLQCRNVIVNNMQGWQGDYEWACYSPLKGVILHQMVEQVCLGMIRLFMGYSPNHFSLAYLLEICNYFNPQASNLFPCQTKKDIALFRLLSSSYWTLRYSGDDYFTDKDMDLLVTRCNEFVYHSSSIVKNELGRIENIELKK